jgi:hypothetical protein
MEVRPATLTKAGLWVAGIAWAPVVTVGLMDPRTHPTGLAIIAWAGTMLGLGLFVAGIGLRLLENIGRKRRRRRPHLSL